MWNETSGKQTKSGKRRKVSFGLKVNTCEQIIFQAYFTLEIVASNGGDFKYINNHSYPLFKSEHIQMIMIIKGKNNNFTRMPSACQKRTKTEPQFDTMRNFCDVIVDKFYSTCITIYTTAVAIITDTVMICIIAVANCESFLLRITSSTV